MIAGSIWAMQEYFPINQASRTMAYDKFGIKDLQHRGTKHLLHHPLKEHEDLEAKAKLEGIKVRQSYFKGKSGSLAITT